MIKFAQQLKKYRTKRQMSQEALAQQLFISRQAISKSENGEGMPDLNTLVKLARILNVSLDELVLAQSHPLPNDNPDYVINPTTGLYQRRYGVMNGWDFVARFWWLVFPIGLFIIACIWLSKLI